MAQPPSLRIQEQVIEEFGVSRKYVVLLAILGMLLLIAAVILSLQDDPLIEAVAVGAGPLAPLIFLAVELVLGAAGVFLLIRAFYLFVAYKYFLTNERVLQAVGFFAQRTVSADYKAITDLMVRQDFINRLVLNTGTLSVNTAGGPVEEIILINIDNPEARREQLRQLGQAMLNGQRVNQHYLAELKQQTGMVDDIVRAHQSDGGHGEHRTQSPAASRQTPDASPLPDRQAGLIPHSSSDEDVEDFNQDGRIDESERVRAAQKKIQAPGGQ